jgi:prepilin-type N-terminal cleavage/methylation domain-containing protein
VIINFDEEKGFTLLEMLTSILISSILVAAVFFLVRSYRSNTEQVKNEIDTQLFVNNFISVLMNEVEAAGHQPIDSLLPTSIFTQEGINKPNVIDVTFSSGRSVLSLSVRYDISPTTRQVIRYDVKDFPRNSTRPSEKAIYKTKINYGDLTSGSPYIYVVTDELVLANVEDFECEASIHPSPISTSASIRGLACSLKMFTTINKNNLRIFDFYAKAANLF